MKGLIPKLVWHERVRAWRHILVYEYHLRTWPDGYDDEDGLRWRALGELRVARLLANTGHYRLAASRYAGAVAHMALVDDLRDRVGMARLAQAGMLTLVGRDRDALDEVDLAVAAGLKPHDRDLTPQAWVVRINAFSNLQCWEDVGVAAEELIELLDAPNSSPDPTATRIALAARARSAGALGDPEPALKAWDEVLALEDDSGESHAEALLAKGGLLEDAGRLEEAASAYTRIMSLPHKRCAPVARARAKARERLGPLARSRSWV